MFKIFTLVITLAAAPLALANNPVSVDAGDFAAQRANIEKGLADGKTYAEISSADRGKVRESLDRMSAMLEGDMTPDALPAERKIDLYNSQETVNTILTQAAFDSRIVCSRDVPTGSHRKVTTCSTAAERTRRRQQDQDALRKEQRAPQPRRD
ncbi:MAG: hypothetical protein DCF27_05720 [Lysobacteraceae bacterium]|nr:MAG: hypothetical protein DCF27_05720 [Xanthomonadaceae bacterium]